MRNSYVRCDALMEQRIEVVPFAGQDGTAGTGRKTGRSSIALWAADVLDEYGRRTTLGPFLSEKEALRTAVRSYPDICFREDDFVKLELSGEAVYRLRRPKSTCLI